MEQFFIDDKFFSSIEDYIEDYFDELDGNEELVKYIDGFPEDWKQDVEIAELETIFPVDNRFFDDVVDMIYNQHEERFPENGEYSEKIKQALIQSVDIEKLNELLPKLFYPCNVFDKITKQDLLDNINHR